jgi:Fe2+ transport system protein FeoA
MRGFFMNLAEAKTNTNITITSLSGSCINLRNLGFCEKLNIIKLQNGKNIICILCGAKIALSENLAQHVIVEEDRLD